MNFYHFPQKFLLPFQTRDDGGRVIGVNFNAGHELRQCAAGRLPEGILI